MKNPRYSSWWSGGPLTSPQHELKKRSSTNTCFMPYSKFTQNLGGTSNPLGLLKSSCLAKPCLWNIEGNAAVAGVLSWVGHPGATPQPWVHQTHMMTLTSFSSWCTNSTVATSTSNLRVRSDYINHYQSTQSILPNDPVYPIVVHVILVCVVFKKCTLYI